MMSGVCDSVSSLLHQLNKDAAASSTLSPPTSLTNSPSKRDVIFVPSSEPQGPIDDLLAAEMGRLSMFLLKGQ